MTDTQNGRQRCDSGTFLLISSEDRRCESTNINCAIQRNQPDE